MSLVCFIRFRKLVDFFCFAGWRGGGVGIWVFRVTICGIDTYRKVQCAPMYAKYSSKETTRKQKLIFNLLNVKFGI